MRSYPVQTPHPDSATRNLLTRAHLAAQAARFAPTPASPFTRGLAAVLLAASLTACGGGDFEAPDAAPAPDFRVPTPCAGSGCLNREVG